MHAYAANKVRFIADVNTGQIGELVLAAYKQNFGRGTGASEIAAWQESLTHLAAVLDDANIPDDLEVIIEYKLAPTGKRVDVMLVGQNQAGVGQVIIIELKQWAAAELTDKDGVIKAFVGANLREVSHPSYQAWVYATLLANFNQAVYENNVTVHACAWLHNYNDDGVITNQAYVEYLAKAPVFLKPDVAKFRAFIAGRITRGQPGLFATIEQGKIKPSPSVVESLPAALEGKSEFVMIDEQKVVFETALALTAQASETNKQVLIVRGGPGTGKSAVAINVLIRLTRQRQTAQYVTKNAAPRAVYEHLLKAELSWKEFSALFSGSGAYQTAAPNTFNALIIDEAHRLNERTGIYGKRGGNQVREIINAAACAIFFVDEDQKVTWDDFGSVAEIERCAVLAGATVHYAKLDSQFRCNGSDDFIAWLDDKLQIRPTPGATFDRSQFDFRVVSSPQELVTLIEAKNKARNRARIVAGRCWDWTDTNPDVKDIFIPEHNFAMRWNLASERNLWIVSPTSVTDAGCIHSAQGLELDYVGVIIGPDLIVRDGQVITDPTKRAKTDTSLKGYKTTLKRDPAAAQAKAAAIIKNTYRTLLTRGMKGCYVYCMDEETKGYFGDKIPATY